MSTRNELDTIRSRLLLIESLRLGYLAIILVTAVVFQIRQAGFISLDIVVPVYAMLSGSFFLNALYVGFFERVFGRYSSAVAVLFGVDACLVTGLIYFTGVDQSIFIFIYLVNISLCGFVFQREGAFLLALLTSILFSLLLILGPQDRGQSTYFVVILNNLAFFAVAFLSGYLSEQLNFMGREVAAREAEIKSLQDLNDMIVENISTGIITVDTRGNIVQCNRAAIDILELKSTLKGLFVKNVLPGFYSDLADEKGGLRRELGRFEMSYNSPKGETLVLGMSSSPLRSSQDPRTVEGHIIIFQDLTKIKRLEKAVRRSEKLAAVGQLAAGIAHEIRNPLASISGSVQLLKSTIDTSQPDEARLMAIVIREIDRLNRLIADFLEFVRPDFKVEDQIDLGALLREVLEMSKMNQSLRSDVEQVVEISTQTKILGQSDKLKQVFINLIFNAYQAMEKSTTPRLLVKLYDEDSKVIAKVKDSGIGMSEDTMNRLFEPFFTTKPHGTGLGLATVHKIVESHRGAIHVESRIGEGTEFTLEFSKAPGESSMYGMNEQRSEAEKIALNFREEMNKFNQRKKRGHG